MPRSANGARAGVAQGGIASTLVHVRPLLVIRVNVRSESPQATSRSGFYRAPAARCDAMPDQPDAENRHTDEPDARLDPERKEQAGRQTAPCDPWCVAALGGCQAQRCGVGDGVVDQDAEGAEGPCSLDVSDER